jgi:hypothetical protein
VSGIYRKKVERLTEALNTPEDRNEAAEAIWALVEKITLRPGPNRGEIDATLQGGGIEQLFSRSASAAPRDQGCRSWKDLLFYLFVLAN